MMAYIQKIVITILLLLVIADGHTGNNEGACVNNMHEDAPQICGSFCQTPGDQSDVRIKDKENMEIPCGNIEQGGKSNWYTYGSVEHGLDIFTYNTSEPKYTVPSSGGIFICTAKRNKSSVTSKEFCHVHKTIIIPPVTDTNENKDNTATYTEGENVTLQCHVNLTVSYALLWIATYRKETSKCLSSVEVIRDTHACNISNNNLCCPFEGIHQRYNHSLHYLDIGNMTTPRLGEYRCYVFFFDKGAHKWKRVNKTFIDVTNGDTDPTGNTSETSNNTGDEESSTEGSCCPASGNNVVHIVSGTIGGLVAIGAILCLVILCIKYKGKQRNVDHSYSNTVPTEYECTPYAVGVGRENKPKVEPDSEYSEIGMGSEAKPFTVYSKIDMKPPVEPSSEYAEVGMDPHIVYSKICKESNKETEVIQSENDPCTAYSVVELKN